jgi:hypothetical protein
LTPAEVNVMLKGRFRRFHAVSSPVAADPPRSPGHGGRAAYDASGGQTWTVEVDLRDGWGRQTEALTACPGCSRGMVIEEVDLVTRVAMLVCGPCALLRARLLPAAATS